MRMRLGLKVLKRKFFRFDTLRWLLSGFKSPSPQWVKTRLLLSQMIPGATWLETGTYLGDTTMRLAKNLNLSSQLNQAKTYMILRVGDCAKRRMSTSF